MKHSATIHLLTATLLSGSVAACAGDAPGAGRALFENNCKCCHGTPPNFMTRPDELADFLRAGTVRLHRFTLDDRELEQLAAYLESLQEN
jgi:mono/diheme cytochrome c family protein